MINDNCIGQTYTLVLQRNRGVVYLEGIEQEEARVVFLSSTHIALHLTGRQGWRTGRGQVYQPAEEQVYALSLDIDIEERPNFRTFCDARLIARWNKDTPVRMET